MIEIYSNDEQLSIAAAKRFIQDAKQAIWDHDYFSVVLSGGNTPKRTYELLAEPEFQEQIPWEQVYVFWGDERCVPPSDSRSNEHMARQTLLDHIPIPQNQIYPMRCSDNADSAAISYAEEIRQFFGQRKPQFDLIYLGLGENGHTASLFPGFPQLINTSNWIESVFLPDQNMYRLTMTPTLINQGKQIIFLISGSDKAAVLSKVLYGQPNPLVLPAQAIHPLHGEILWLVQKDAATTIEKDKLKHWEHQSEAL